MLTLDKDAEIAAAVEAFERALRRGLVNPSDVLTPSPSPYSSDHFAPYPSELIGSLILSSVPRWSCPHCGRGWAPKVDPATGGSIGRDWNARKDDVFRGKCRARETPQGYQPARVVGYRSTCSCGAKAAAGVPGIVLDPFCGSGTTGEVARECGVRFVGPDISFEYFDDHAMWRSEREHSLKRINELPLFSAAS